jgi:hypothetical protein
MRQRPAGFAPADDGQSVVGPHTGPPRLRPARRGNEKGSSMFIGIGTIVLIIIIVLIVLALRR